MGCFPLVIPINKKLLGDNLSVRIFNSSLWRATAYTTKLTLKLTFKLTLI